MYNNSHYPRNVRLKEFEQADHLGNVRLVFTDMKLYDPNTGTNSLDIVAANNYYPGGSLMPEAYYNAENYRHSYQGSEKDDEITGTTGTHITTHYRENDTRLLRWWSHDPKANASESQYMSMGGNPIWHNDVLGDTIIIDNLGYTTRVDRGDDDNLIDNLVFTTGDNGNLTPLGELTKGVDANQWFTNLLSTNSKEADDIWNPMTFRDYVAKDGKWDYKNLNSGNKKLGTEGRKEHLLGIAFSLDDDTKFSFEGSLFRSEDLNNFHFGVAGKATGLFTETFMLEKAGEAEIGKWKDLGKEVPSSWRPFIKVTRIRGGILPMTYDIYELQPPYGDNPIDHEMIKNGFKYYNKNRSFLDGDLW